jgi:predicted RNase H-like nuclease (RuvC/YqgF family)
MSFQPELEPYKEVIDIMSARIKRAEQHNTYLREAVAECQKRIERLNAELENVAWTSSPALAQAQIDQLVARNAELEKDKARLDWLLLNPINSPRADSVPRWEAGVPSLPLPRANGG